MLKNRLLAATAAFALVSAQVSPGYALLPSPDFLTPDGTVASKSTTVGFVSTAIATLKTYVLALLQQNYTLQVPSAAALRTTAVFTGVLAHRGGYATAGDGGGADYAGSTSGCPGAIGDDGASCLNAPGGSWRIDAGTRFRPRIWGALGGTSDDTAAWTKALAYLGTLGGAQELVNDFPTSTIAGARITVPRNVVMTGIGTEEGADSDGLATLHFSAAQGGFYFPQGSGFRHLSFVADNANVDHLLEIAGQVGFDSFKCNYQSSCIRLTTTILPPGPGVSATVSARVNAGAGLTNGTYTSVAFTGGGGTGATLAVTISGGAISSVSFASGGTGYLPWFDWGLAAGALYSGSPAITTVGQIGTCNPGRSHIRNGFLVSNGATNIGLEMDAAYDYVDIDDVEIWSPTGIQGNSIGMKFGHIDGLNLHNPKIFGINFAVNWTTASTGPQGFAAISSPQLDGVSQGINITFPLIQLGISGGYMRCIFKCAIFNDPLLNVAWSGTSLFRNADAAVYLQDFASAALGAMPISLNSATGNANFPAISIGSGSTPVGKGYYSIDNVAFDGLTPGVAANSFSQAGRLGSGNFWPGRRYAATDGNGNPTLGYASINGSGQAAAITGGQVSLTTNASGQVTVSWNLGSSSQSPSVTVLGAAAAAGYTAGIVSIGTEGMVVQMSKGGNPAASGVGVILAWQG